MSDVTKPRSWLDPMIVIIDSTGKEYPRRRGLKINGATVEDNEEEDITEATVAGGDASAVSRNETGTGSLNDVVTLVSTVPAAELRFTGVAPTVKGLASGTAARRLVVLAVGGPLVLANQSVDSITTNRIITGTGADVTIPVGAGALLDYDATTLRWRLVSASAAATLGVPEVIFKPGVASVGRTVATWAEVVPYITIAGGLIDVLCDPSIAPCHVPGSANTECFGYTRIGAFDKFVDGATLTIDDGGRIRNLAVLDGMYIQGAPTAVKPLVFDTVGDILLLRGGAAIFSTTGATVAMLDVQLSMVISCVDYSYFDNSAAPTIPIISIAATKTLNMYMRGNDPAVSMPARLVQGAAGTTFYFQHDSSIEFVAQPLFLGTLSEVRWEFAAALQPSKGTTAQRPTLPFAGQEYFDTTLGFAIWWDGAAWVVPIQLPLALADLDPTGASNGDVVTRIGGVWSYATPNGVAIVAMRTSAIATALVFGTDYHLMLTAAVAATLPTAPANGTSFEVESTVAGGSVVRGGGDTIVGATSYVFVAGECITLRYNAATTDWRIC